MAKRTQLTAHLGPILRRRREQLGLSKREAARRIGISPSYLLTLELGRNPSTGRAPVPSPPVLAALGRVLGIDLETLLEASGAPAPSSAHVLLYQTGSRHRSSLPAAQSLYRGQVNAWVEILDPRITADPGTPPGAVTVSAPREARPADQAGPAFRPSHAMQAACAALAESQPPGTRLGIIFGGSSAALREAQHATALLGSEASWENDVAAAVTNITGAKPLANVCVYHEADIQEAAHCFDPLAALLTLITTHPHVAVQDQDNAVMTGPAAIERILEPVRPAAVSSDSWATLARAAAIGLARTAAP